MKLPKNENVIVNKNYTGACIFDGKKYNPIMEGHILKIISNDIIGPKVREYTVKWCEEIKDVALYDMNGILQEKLWNYILDYTQGLILIEIKDPEKWNNKY